MEPVNGAIKYLISKNGKIDGQEWAPSVSWSVKEPGEYTIMAVDKNDVSSFVSEPILVIDSTRSPIYEAEQFVKKSDHNYKGFSGSRFIETSTTLNTKVEIPIMVNAAGNYVIDCKYANGNGPTNTENKCAIRTLLIDDKPAGVFVLPQRGKNEWSNWGYTNSLPVSLSKGKHTITIAYLPTNENMNGEINQAMIDFVRLINVNK